MPSIIAHTRALIRGSSNKPNHRGDKVDGAQKVVNCPVIVRGNRTVLLQTCKQVLHEMRDLVEMAVIFARLRDLGLRRNHHSLAFAQQRLNSSTWILVF